MMAKQSALLFVSFGGPESPEEVMPFLRRVTAGRGVPDQRLRQVGQHYFDRDGVSPINQLCRDMIASVECELAGRGLDLRVYWGNRNSKPFLDDTVAAMAADGIEHAFAFITSAFGSNSGCRQYLGNIASARDKSRESGLVPPKVDKLRLYFNHPGFIDPFVDRLVSALKGRPAETTQVLFSAHSIPTPMAENSRYVDQIEAAIELVVAAVDGVDGASARPDHRLVWQSRSGPPTMPWLEPDIVDAINALDESTTDVVVVPIGFVSDHMEVLQDLDTDAAAAAAARGFDFGRVATPGTDPRFIEMIVDLVEEQLSDATPVALGPLGLEPTQCSALCCPGSR